MIRKISSFICAAVFIVGFASFSYAMGGPAVEVQEKTTAEVQQPASGEALPGDIESAKTELTTLEAQREKTENYLEILNSKIINAKMAKDAKKISELQAAERIMADRNNKIVKRISAIRQKYPELQPAGKTGEATGEASIKEEEPQAAGANIVYHEVEMGDTLVGISRKYFGTPIYYREIATMNNIADTGNISQGTRLKIDLNMAQGHKFVPEPAESAVIYHVVMPGDTLMGISRKYFNGSASYYKEIAEMNGITGTGLKVGMKLKIDMSLMKKAKPEL
jgi:nucleoid-associated protein YgaU